MRAKTELFLYMLSWRGEQLSQPTCHRIQQSFEGWAYQNGLLPRIQKLEAEGFLAKHPQAADLSGVMQLTEKGRQAALGGHDPEKAWTRKWDRTWHMILFDLPADETALRKAFLRTLRANGFGCLQGSVWISPCIPGEMTTYLKGHPTRPCRLLHLKAKSSGKQADMRLVKDGWLNWRAGVLGRDGLTDRFLNRHVIIRIAFIRPNQDDRQDPPVTADPPHGQRSPIAETGRFAHGQNQEHQRRQQKP
jgi:hypothetical protein